MWGDGNTPAAWLLEEEQHQSLPVSESCSSVRGGLVVKESFRFMEDLTFPSFPSNSLRSNFGVLVKGDNLSLLCGRRGQNETCKNWECQKCLLPLPPAAAFMVIKQEAWPKIQVPCQTTIVRWQSRRTKWNVTYNVTASPGTSQSQTVKEVFNLRRDSRHPTRQQTHRPVRRPQRATGLWMR